MARRLSTAAVAFTGFVMSPAGRVFSRAAIMAARVRCRYLARSVSGAAVRMLLIWVMTATRARMAVARSARRTRRDSTRAIPGFWCCNVPAGQRSLGRLVRVQGIGFAPEPASLPVRAHDFQNPDAFPGQDTGEFGTVAAGAFHPGGNDLAEPDDEGRNAPVARTHSEKLFVRNVSAGLVDDCDVVGVGVSVDPGDDFQMLVCHDEASPAFRCVRWDTKGHAGRVGRQDSNGILRAGSYEVMSTWPPRLLQPVPTAGQIIFKTNPSRGASVRTRATPAAQANFIITVSPR